ncbi:MAG TPA: carboxypeptidase regulatory-like domain-containing protein [Pyrinomonadaceae bacterium]|nr:carboxypeptidase regulatory-like domain-containing protein [Pyrinomonadaceae bacterium]
MSTKRVKPGTTRLVVTAVVVLIAIVLVFFFYLDTNAQTVKADPSNIVDPSKPGQVKLQIIKNKLPDTTIATQVKSVKHETLPAVTATVDNEGTITFTPPANLAGDQTFQLLDVSGNAVNGDAGPLSVQLNYGGATATPNSTASPTASPTPDMAWIERFNAEVRRNNVVNRWWYYPLVIVAFLGLFGAFAYVIVRGILFSRATFRTATGLPVGSFRAILAYTLVLFVGFYVLISLLVVSNFPPPEFLLGIVATVIGFYFGSRSGEEGALDTRAGTVRGIVRKGSNTLSGALVKFRAADNTEPYSRITDVDGRFELRAAKPGKYKVIAEVKTPPATGEQEVTVSEGSDQEIEITIKEGASTTTTTPAAQPGTVVGVVKNADGTFPSQATVELAQGANKVEGKVDPNTGEFKVSGLKPGTYDIEAKTATTSSGRESVAVTAGKETKKDLTLKPQ